ncbi:hypothetical protein GCM10029964_069830 [Kibdelosporangium lantanae]
MAAAAAIGSDAFRWKEVEAVRDQDRDDQMNLQGWIYVATKDYGTREAVITALRELGARLETKVDDSIAGFAAVALVEPDDFEEYDIDRREVEGVTHGRLPAIHLNITYDLDLHRVDDPEIAELLSAAGMTHVVTDPVGD